MHISVRPKLGYDGFCSYKNWNIYDTVIGHFFLRIDSAFAAMVTDGFLNDMLRDIKDDAVLIYEHKMKTNADHIM